MKRVLGRWVGPYHIRRTLRIDTFGIRAREREGPRNGHTTNRCETETFDIFYKSSGMRVIAWDVSTAIRLECRIGGRTMTHFVNFYGSVLALVGAGIATFIMIGGVGSAIAIG
jgi:hypothetical protein